ncbi:unnamed protein product [Soboliphyme baturini]|uniref:NOL1/NOP2/Sun domain family member 4 n=1 Tax=Soboliphyme baturini TaxID=241478 RepID=A0A183IKR4_9BILA|nr:unnamed protein product [Soboliphyme baturini]
MLQSLSSYTIAGYMDSRHATPEDINILLWKKVEKFSGQPDFGLELEKIFLQLSKLRYFKARAEKKSPANLAMQHFDFYYKPIFRKRWPSIRIGLLSDPKYCAVVNNYAADPDVIQRLLDDGAVDIIDKVKKRKALFHSKLKGLFPDNVNASSNMPSRVGGDSMYPSDADGCDDDAGFRSESGLSMFLPPVDMIVRETTSATLALDSADTPLYDLKNQVLPDDVQYPSVLQVLAYPSGDITTFKPSPAFSNGCLVYYLMDAASVVPVLALGIQPGDTVLDMCAAPGGKSIVALQTLLPGEFLAVPVCIA